MRRTLLLGLALLACTPTASIQTSTTPVAREPESCVTQVRRLATVREEVIGSIATGQQGHEGLVLLTASADPRVLHRWQLSPPDAAIQRVPTVDPIVLPPELEGFIVERRFELDSPDALLVEWASPSSARALLLEVAAEGSGRVHDAAIGRTLAATRHRSGGLIRVSVDGDTNLQLTAPEARATLHAPAQGAVRYAVALERMWSGHILSAVVMEATEDVFLLARLDEEGAIVWQRILARHPSAPTRRSPRWQHDTLGAPVVSVDPQRFVVAFGARSIHVHSLDLDTGATLAEVASQPAYDDGGSDIPWIPLSITAAPNHHQIVARSCIGAMKCGLTSLKWTGGDTLPNPVLKLWFSKFAFPDFHDLTNQHQARLVLATRELNDDTTNWWVIELPDSCREDRVPGTVPREIDSRLPY